MVATSKKLNPNYGNKHKYLNLNTKLEVTHFCEVSGLSKSEIEDGMDTLDTLHHFEEQRQNMIICSM
jgi:hypothetical protein